MPTLSAQVLEQRKEKPTAKVIPINKKVKRQLAIRRLINRIHDIFGEKDTVSSNTSS